MKKHWVELCRAQRIPVLPAPPVNHCYTEIGQIIVRDSTGGLAPLGSFELCDKASDMVVYPCQTLNTTEREVTLAMAMGLAMMWRRSGFLLVRFGLMADSSELVCLDVEEEDKRHVTQLLHLRGHTLSELAGRLDRGEPVSCLGNIAGLTELGLSCGTHFVRGLTVRELFAALPAELLSPETMSPWFRRQLAAPIPEQED